MSSLQDIYDFYQDGGTLASLSNLTQQDLNDLHSYAYTAYQSGDVITARNLFHLLTYLEHWNYDYTLSLGLCHQRLSNHEDAQLCFARCKIPGHLIILGLATYWSEIGKWPKKPLRLV